MELAGEPARAVKETRYRSPLDALPALHVIAQRIRDQLPRSYWRGQVPPKAPGSLYAEFIRALAAEYGVPVRGVRSRVDRTRGLMRRDRFPVRRDVYERALPYLLAGATQREIASELGVACILVQFAAIEAEARGELERPKPVTPHIVALRVKGGMSVREIAWEYDKSEHYIQTLITRAQRAGKLAKPKRNIPTTRSVRDVEREEEEIVAEYQKGYSLDQLGARYHRSGSTVSQLLRRYGVPARTRGKMAPMLAAERAKRKEEGVCQIGPSQVA